MGDGNTREADRGGVAGTVVFYGCANRFAQLPSKILTIGRSESDWKVILFGKGCPAVKIAPLPERETAMARVAIRHVPVGHVSQGSGGLEIEC